MPLNQCSPNRPYEILHLPSAVGHGLSRGFNGAENMYFTTEEALAPDDLTLLRTALEEVCRESEITANGKGAGEIAQELIILWHAGFRSTDELKNMLQPMNIVG